MLGDEAVEEKVQEFMETGESPFQAHMENGALWHKAEATLNDVREKHEDIKRLESGTLLFHCVDFIASLSTRTAGITELADMFNDLALLVSNQGEILDRIEENVSNTVNFTHSAVENLQKSNAYARSNRYNCQDLFCNNLLY